MRTLPGLFLLALPLVSCAGAKDDSGAGEPCDVTVSLISPIDGQSDFNYRAAVTVQLSDADATATLAVVDPAGVSVAGVVAADAATNILSFTPSAPLEPSTAYTLDISTCGGDSSVGFSTSDLGSPLSGSLVGRTYAVDPSSGRFVEPSGAGSILGAVLTGKVLLGVVAEGATLEMIGALSAGDSDSQDTCNRTTPVPSVDFSASPYFELPKGDVELAVAGMTLAVGDMSISGTFSSDGAYFGGGSFSGELDMREVAPLASVQLGETSADELCSLLGDLSVPCQPCGADGASYCISVLVDELTAQETGETLMPITEADCNETCALSCDNDACAAAADYAICQ